MGTTLAAIGLIGGVIAIVAIELLASGDKSAFYRAVMIGVGLISIIALLVSIFFSSPGVNWLGTVLAVIGIVIVGLFYTFGETKRVESTPPASNEQE